jgi:hypothetical protein
LDVATYTITDADAGATIAAGDGTLTGFAFASPRPLSRSS